MNKNNRTYFKSPFVNQIFSVHLSVFAEKNTAFLAKWI